jgi:hypothetical protein
VCRSLWRHFGRVRATIVDMSSGVGTRALAAAGAAGVLLLAACGSSTSTGAGQPTPGTATSASPAPSASSAAASPAPSSSEHEHTGGIKTAASRSLSDGSTVVDLPMPGGSYTPSAPNGGTDDYHCFLLDPKVAHDTFLTGTQVVPDNAHVVHHAILFRVSAQDVAGVKAKDASTPGQGWSCFGDAGVPSSSPDPVAALNSAPWLAAWAPGAGEARYRAGTGIALTAGSQIIMQIHYNLLHGSGPDSSGVRLRFAPKGADLVPLHTTLLVAPVELPCAPGQSGPLCSRDMAVLDVTRRFGDGAGRTVAGLQLLCGGSIQHPKAGPTQSCDRPVTSPETIYAVAGHMHLLGRHITVTLNPGRPTARTLLDIPVWDFDNQGAHPLAVPAKVGPGDVLRVTCTHDPTLRHKIPEISGLPDRYVVWGEGTSDEMCLAILTASDR